MQIYAKAHFKFAFHLKKYFSQFSKNMKFHRMKIIKRNFSIIF